MRRTTLNFFKKSAFAKSFFVLSAAFLATLSISCKQLATFDPVVNGDGGQTNVGGSSSETTEFAFDLKATHGLVKKISLEWNAFSGAKYYEVFFAEGSTAEFVKIGETDKNFFDDKNVGAGKTFYYKVRAVKSNGTQSPFSSTVVGTSLAVPIINDGEVEDYKATISWSMENARGIDGTDYYEKSLKFEVVCQAKGGSEGETKVFSASSFKDHSYKCTFENLSSSQDYEFYVEAYLDGDTQGREKSPTVDKTTLTAYSPLAPKFSASEGDSAKGISLLITLPEMVTARTYVEKSDNPKELQDVPYPLCFKIFRKHERDENYSDNPKMLYYGENGFTTSPVEYKEGGKPYEAGKQVTWFDDDAALIGGEKYDYMILSVTDVGYDAVVCPKDNQGKTEVHSTSSDKATTSQGWKSATPSFKVKFDEDGGRILSEDKTKVLSVSFGFEAEWKDLGKAKNYKFAIRQIRTPWGGGNDEEEFLKNDKTKTIFFETLDEVKSRVTKFGSASGGLSDNEQGYYSYTLYIVSNNDAGTYKIENDENILDSVKAMDQVVVTVEVNLPKAELKVEGGYKDKVKLTVSSLEEGAKYTVIRTRLENGKPTDDIENITLSTPESGSFEYTDNVDNSKDKSLHSNCAYSYVLKAEASSGAFALSTSQEAEVLGTPAVSFRKEKDVFSYDSVTISFDGVLAAKNYTVTLGAGGDFGGGKRVSFAAGFDGSMENAVVKLTGNTYTVTIKEPSGYDDALKAGTSAATTVTAHSVIDNAQSNSVDVNVLGPAKVGATVNAATENSVSITWDKVDGANGYLIRRVMYDPEVKNAVEDSGITYYYDVSGGKITLAGGGELYGRATVDFVGGKFHLVDKYDEADKLDDPEVGGYQKEQAKIFWGMPFKYVVLPVLKEDDFGFETDSLKLGRGVAYKNLQQTEPVATFGYGLDVHAEKSKSDSKQTITWKKPFKNGDKEPCVLRRIAGTKDNFERLISDPLNKDTTSFTYSPSESEKYGAYEYIVRYNATAGSLKPPEPLITDFENAKDEESATEQKNKGYLFTVPNDWFVMTGLSAAQGGANAYAECVTWASELDKKIWDHKSRALGPTGIKLYVRNNNLDDQWHPVASIAGMNYSDVATVLENDTSVKSDNNGVSLWPADYDTGAASTTNGALKVLRDYKHYYAISLIRAAGEDVLETQKYTPGFGDFTGKTAVAAWRQITNEELVRAATLAMSVGIKNSMPKSSWSRTGSPSKTWDENSGTSSGSVYTKWTAMSYDIHNITFNSCVAKMTAKSGDTVASFLKLDGSIGGKLDSNYARSIPPDSYTGTITIKNLLNNETATLKFDAAKKDSTNKIILTRNNVSSNFGNITPLPYNGQGDSGFLNDYEEWQ